MAPFNHANQLGPGVEQLNRHPPLGRIYPFGGQSGSATMINGNSPNRFEVGATPVECMSAVVAYTWSPSHDQRGMLRPFGTSSADWW
jgi:hypothetical protein